MALESWKNIYYKSMLVFSITMVSIESLTITILLLNGLYLVITSIFKYLAFDF